MPTGMHECLPGTRLPYGPGTEHSILLMDGSIYPYQSLTAPIIWSQVQYQPNI